MPHADAAPARAETHEAALAIHPDDGAPAIKDATLMLWVVLGAIAAWSLVVYFFVL